MREKLSRKRRILNHLGNLGMAMLSLVLINSPASAVDSVETANQVVVAESSSKATKEVLNLALQAVRSKPAMTHDPCHCDCVYFMRSSSWCWVMYSMWDFNC